MIEPQSPVTVKVRYSPYPAVLLASDENSPLKPKSIILRHRHLRQQQRVSQRFSNSVAGSSRPTRGVAIGTVSQSTDLPDSPIVGSVALGASRVLPYCSAVASQLGLTEVPSVTPAAAPVAVPVSAPIVAPVSAPIVVPAPALAPETEPALVVVTAPARPLIVQPPLASASAQAGGGGSKARSGPERLKNPAIVPPESTGQLVLTRGTHAIRSTAYKTTWWMTKGRDYLRMPVTVPAVQVGDLYVHLASDGQQAWLRTPSHEWITVEEKHAHPLLRDYLLRFLDNGEPRWVTKESLRTYNGRVKKAERAARSHSEDSS